MRHVRDILQPWSPSMLAIDFLVWSLRLSSGWWSVPHLVLYYHYYYYHGAPGLVTNYHYYYHGAPWRTWFDYQLLLLLPWHTMAHLVLLSVIIYCKHQNDFIHCRPKPGVADDHLNAPLSSCYELHLIRTMMTMISMLVDVCDWWDHLHWAKLDPTIQALFDKTF